MLVVLVFQEQLIMTHLEVFPFDEYSSADFLGGLLAITLIGGWDSLS